MGKYICDRCRLNMASMTMSMMNTDIICPTCKDKEKEHPRYEEAAEAELGEVKKGTRNYGGLFAGQKWPIGWTEDAPADEVEGSDASWGFEEPSLGDVMEPIDFN